MARDRKTITDYLAETEEPIDELWLAQILGEAQGALDELQAEHTKDQS